MARGKYSPNLPRGKEFIYNCYGKVPLPWSKLAESYGLVYDEKVHFANYDDEGYDSYGYRAFDIEGNYVGIGNGVDRNGYTEYEYLCMTDDQWEDAQCYLTPIPKPDTIHTSTRKQENEMARETKAQRLEREAAETAQQVALAKATYTERLMAVLERATKINFELEVKNAMFVVTDRDDRYRQAFLLQPTWTETADMDMYSLEMSVEFSEAARAELERVANLRKTALAKLTDEERKALSL